MSKTKLDELAALGEELLAEMARMRETVAAMDRSLSVLERTVAELRQDVTRLGERVDRLQPRIDGIEARLDRIELRLVARRGSDGGNWCVIHRCRQERTAAVATADRGGRSERDQRFQRRGDFRRGAGVVGQASAEGGS
jgi:septal ring factor EnvC (AmiA/AmiB activator)